MSIFGGDAISAVRPASSVGAQILAGMPIGGGCHRAVMLIVLPA